MELPLNDYVYMYCITMFLCVWWFTRIVITIYLIARMSQLIKDVTDILLTLNYEVTVTNTEVVHISSFHTEDSVRFHSVKVVCTIVLTQTSKQKSNKVICAHASTILKMLILFLKTYRSHYFKTITRLGRGPMYLITGKYSPDVRHSLVVYPFSFNQLAEEIVFESTSEQNLMKYEWSRYLSFKTFPQDSVMTPMRLSQAGFYYTGHGEEVKCFCCGMTNGLWTTDETAVDVHKRMSPNCVFISEQNTNNVPIHRSDYYADMFVTVRNNENISNTESLQHNRRGGNRNNTDGQAETFRGRHSCNFTSTEQERAENPNYVNMSDRINSFRGGTGQQHVQSPHELAQAGFFYVGVNDFVRCFYCGLGLKNWMKSDNSLHEHARWSPNCQYLKKVLQVQESLPQANLTNNDQPVDNAALRQSDSEMMATVKSQSEMIEKYRTHLRCKICLNNESDVVFLPCGHMVSCQACALRLKTCPICRNIIKGTVRVYQS